ncbi:MAG: 1-(5-phosphoribosyl)-5-[Desulfovibrio sp.]|nr:1-(5-phosphoribosyl)-5-[(5-phosphoribosylamino)methylideneamino]imidazole-4-carboxamide isomerase [Desulfovibrio sp.]
MIIFPAVDIQKGKAVRLKQGIADAVTVFSDNPVSCALHWQKLGAKWLHVIDLDGAFAGNARNFSLVKEICQALTIPVQLGGGIRSIETASRYLDCGVDRLIIGTMALEDEDLFATLCKTYPQKIGVSLDAQNGILKTRGWVSDSAKNIFDVLPAITAQGAAFLIYTDIARDGMQSGPNLEMLKKLLQKTTIPILAAGGIATLDDIKALYPLSINSMLAGVISGRALYEGSLQLEEANNWLSNQI